MKFYYINTDSELMEVTCDEKDPDSLAELVGMILEHDKELERPVNASTMFVIYGIVGNTLLNKKFNKHSRVKNQELWQRLCDIIAEMLSDAKYIRNSAISDLSNNDLRGFVINNTPMFHAKIKPITSREIGVTDIYRIVYGTKIYAEIKTEGLTVAQVLTEIDEKMYSIVKAIKEEGSFLGGYVYHNNVVTLVSYKLNNYSGVANNLTMLEMREYPFNYLLFGFDVCDDVSAEHINNSQH